jgi:crotonobetainyl-CoA:carnitine CoA-transferase CaiB-like acyl-CoA transferase
VEYFQENVVRERTGNRAQGFQPLDSFAASDGWVVLGALAGVYGRLLKVIGLDPANPRWEIARTQLESIEGIEFDAMLRGWISERTVKEVVAAMTAGSVPCSAIMSSKTMAADAQYRARGMHVEWEDEQVGRVKGIGIAPQFSLTPGKIVRGSVPLGHDNDRVYCEMLGVSADEIASLRRDKII